jgi:hypothetical protein
VSADIGTGGQAKFSQDSIAEFQFVANRFDATMGRSTGVQVNAITKSGSNQLSGLFRGNFRDDKFNAENPVLHVVEPVNNQQYSTTLGGPDRQGQAALLRQLRVRARAAHEHLQLAVPGVQRQPDRQEHAEEGRRSSRLPAVLADTRDGQVLARGNLRTVRCRQ